MAGVLASASPFIDWTWIETNERLIVDALGQHVELSVIAVICGLAISLPLAFIAWRYRRLRTAILGATGLLYTIPSIALFILIAPLTGYYGSIVTPEVALVGYTLLILVRNILIGLDAVPEEVREATTALGYSRRGAIVRVYLPLALPSIFAGLRVATVTVIGLVTVTALVGWGGLGQLAVTGLSESFYTPIVVSLVGSVILAAIGDGLIVALEHSAIRWQEVRR
jgi:osmoprotectant transport system permease protein